MSHPARGNVDILFLSHRHEITGGAEMALLEMLAHLSEVGLKNHVIVGAEGSFSKQLGKLSIPYSVIGQPYWAHGPEDDSPFSYSGPNPIVNPTLHTVRLIKNLHPKLCVTNTMVVPWLAYAAAITGVRHAWFIHELGTTGIKLQYHLGEEQTLRTIDQLSDAVFYNSRTVAKYYITRFHSNKSVRLVYPGGSLAETSKVTSPFRPEAFKLISVGQIKPQKGQADAVEAIEDLRAAGRDVQLAIIGADEDVAYAQKLRTQVHATGLDQNVLFLGHKPNPNDYVVLADAALVCSTNEAFGRVTVEAMLLGKPVIGANSGGTAEIIEDGKTGLLYRPGDVEDLADKINSLLKKPSWATSLGRTGQRDAQDNYSDKARYKEFLHYFYSMPTARDALDLRPLDSVFTDFEATIILFKDREAQLKAWRQSKLGKLYRLYRKVVVGLRPDRNQRRTRQRNG